MSTPGYIAVSRSVNFYAATNTVASHGMRPGTPVSSRNALPTSAAGKILVQQN